MTAKKSPDALLRKGPSKKLSMTAVEFAALEPFLDNISTERLKAARLVLVDGMTYEGAAKVINLGWTRQAVADCVRVVRKAFQAFQKASAVAQSDKEIPPGWERVTLVAPSELISDFYEQIAAHAPGTKRPGSSPSKEKGSSQPRQKKTRNANEPG